MFGALSGMVLSVALTAVGFYVLYVVVRRAVRDGVRDAAAISQATGADEDVRN